ncbi:MerR family transcriptional regulator [Actinomadura sp. 3N407]|uniref:MerR family transcriptional regulator n=1 Tax=Actinomadura sp. 3N407 TaxID=3457423 RepID=UPI003FCC6F6D
MAEKGLDIEEVVARTGLSPRTVRHYAQLRLVVPSVVEDTRRLYSVDDVARLHLLRRIRPIGFTLREMRELLATLQVIDNPVVTYQRPYLLERLEMFQEVARFRTARLAEELQQARQFTAAMDAEIARCRQDFEQQ